MSIDFFGIPCERALEISVAQQSETLTGFPVLLPTPPSWHPFWSDVLPDGSDIYCVDSMGAVVPHELVSIDTSAKTIQLYARYTLSSLSTTTVYVLYKGYENTGNTSSDTWSNYYAVYHMDSTSGAESDAAGVYNGTVTGADRGQTGQVGKSMLFTAGDTQDRVTNASAGNWQYTQPWSVSAYVNPSSAATMTLLSKYEPVTDARGWSVGFISSGSDVQATMIISNDNAPATRVYVNTTTAYSTGVWRHYGFTYSGSGNTDGCTVYVNGSPSTLTKNDDSLAGNTILNSATFAVGAQYGAATQTSWLDGYVDEVRVRVAISTLGWMSAEYDNLSSPGTFSSIVTTYSRKLHRCCPKPTNLVRAGMSGEYQPAHPLLMSTIGFMGSPGTTSSGFTS